MSRKSAERKHDLTADDHQRQLVKLIHSFAHSHRPHEVFSDFVELSALSISNSVDRSQFYARERRYLEIVGKYTKEEFARFSEMFGELTLSFEKRVGMMRHAIDGGHGSMGLTDVLGETYMMLELGNARAGQFFTPYSVSRLMAMMTVGDGTPFVQEQGFIRLQEPACGAAGMVIAVAESLHEAGHNYQQVMHATCVDIDPCCVHMAYVQLSLLHIPATVVHGNALSLQVWGVWHTPAHVLGGWRYRLARRVPVSAPVNPVQQPVQPDQFAPDPVESGGTGPLVDADDDVLVAGFPAVTAAETKTATPDVAHLFEDALTAHSASPTIFEKIDQLSLF